MAAVLGVSGLLVATPLSASAAASAGASPAGASPAAPGAPPAKSDDVTSNRARNQIRSPSLGLTKAATTWIERARADTVARSGAVFIENATTEVLDVSVTDAVSGQTVPLYAAVPAGLLISQPVLIPAGTYLVQFVHTGTNTVVASGPLTVVGGEDLTFGAQEGVPAAVTYLNRYRGLPATLTRFSFRNATPVPVDGYIDGIRVVQDMAPQSSFDIDLPPAVHKVVMRRSNQPLVAASVIDDVTFLPSPAAFIDDIAYFTGTGGGYAATGISLVSGYTLGAADGGIFDYGTQPYQGGAGDLVLNEPIVGSASAGRAQSYYEVARDGGVFAFGSGASFQGSAGGQSLAAPIVGMAVDPITGGYWLVAADGGVFAYDAPYLGGLGGQKLDAPVVGIAADPTTGGYYLVAADGGVFAFGSQTGSFGSLGGTALHAPIVGMSVTPDGFGYWLTSSDGGVFAFGDASFLGSAAALPLNQPVVAIVGSADGLGYTLVAKDGGVFEYGDAGFYGSTGSLRLNKPIVAAF